MPGKKWSKDENLQLIAAYKKHPLLYNKFHPDYNSSNDRENALMYIVDELQDSRPGTLLPEVKKRITNLRTQYFKAKKIVTEARKRGQKLESKLWFYKDIQFIEDKTIMSEDPLDMANIRNTTWFPDIDDDTLSELSFSEETENVRPHKNGCSIEIDSSPQPVEILEDIQPAITLLEDDISSALIDQQTVELLDNDLNESADDLSTEASMNNTENTVTPEKPTIQSKRPIQSSLQTSIENAQISSKNLKRRNSSSLSNTNELQTKLNNLDNLTSEADELMGSSTNSEQANNRAFVENLLYDLDDLSADVLQRVKWQITNEVYEAFHDANEQQKIKKQKTRAKI